MRTVKYTRDYVFKPSRAVSMVRSAGEEWTITEAEFAAASEAGVIEEVSNGEGAKSRKAPAKARGNAAAGQD